MTSAPDPGAADEHAHEEAGRGWQGAWATDAQRLFQMLHQAADSARAGGEHDHATAAECRFCPICQGLATFRRSGPEILDKIAEFASGLAATLRAVDRDRPSARESDHAQSAGLSDAGRRANPVVPPTMHIDITD